MKIQQLRPGRWGDQSFWGVGFPSIDCYSMAEPEKRAVVGGSGGGWWWHTPEDTLDKADPDYQVRDTRTNLALVLGLCNAEILPMDFSKTADQYVTSLTELASKTGQSFNLNPLISKARALKAQAGALKTASAKLGKQKGRTAAGRTQHINATYMKLSRSLVPVLFTQSGRYDQDPAADAPFFPGLQKALELTKSKPDDNSRGFLLNQLTRERNRISDALDQALSLIDNCLANIKA